jgi:hypothetical protein
MEKQQTGASGRLARSDSSPRGWQMTLWSGLEYRRREAVQPIPCYEKTAGNAACLRLEQAAMRAAGGCGLALRLEQRLRSPGRIAWPYSLQYLLARLYTHTLRIGASPGNGEDRHTSERCPASHRAPVMVTTT